jgi:glycosyltransferase involved in cell wall biosynthesis
MDLGSCREVIEHGVTGFLVNNAGEAVQALDRVPEIDPSACRRRVERCFSISAMVQGYEQVYGTIFETEADKRAERAVLQC